MKIVKKNKTYFINIENIYEEKKIEPYLDKFLDVNSISKEEFLISVRKNTDVKDKSSIKKKIILLLEDKDLSYKDKVEGSFENLLKKEDLIIFKEMLENKEIEVFKLSSKYKKGVYKLSQNTLSNQNNIYKSNDISSSDFDITKYIIIKNLEDAKNFSSNYESQIKSGEIIGIKSFDGNYYVIFKQLFLDVREKILSLNLSSTFSISFLEEKTKLSKDVLKIVLELLKEEGFVIEKKKDNYQFI